MAPGNATASTLPSGTPMVVLEQPAKWVVTSDGAVSSAVLFRGRKQDDIAPSLAGALQVTIRAEVREGSTQRCLTEEDYSVEAFGFHRAHPAGLTALFRAVELLGDQAAMPGENGLRRDDGCNLREDLAAEPLTDLGQFSTFSVAELETAADLSTQNAILRGEVLATEE